jgi:hypothetical protein
MVAYLILTGRATRLDVEDVWLRLWFLERSGSDDVGCSQVSASSLKSDRINILLMATCKRYDLGGVGVADRTKILF